MGPKEGQKTLLQAYRNGYIPKSGTRPVEVWCGFTHHYYYNPGDLRKHPAAAKARLKKYFADQRAARKARKAAEAAEAAAEAAERRARIRIRNNTKTRYQWAKLGYIVNADAVWEWGEYLGPDYGKNYLYTYATNVHEGTDKEMEPWWRFFLLELKLGRSEQTFEELRRELLRLCPEYPESVIETWLKEQYPQF